MASTPVKLKRIHHVEFWVGNAKQAGFYYRNALGFSQFAYAGLETGDRAAASYALRQGKAIFVVSSPLAEDSPLGDHVRKHGDGVRDIAFEVDDADAAHALAVERGAVSAREPHTVSDRNGTIRRAAIRTYGDTIHSFISKKDYAGPFLPGYEASEAPGRDVGLVRIDHVVGNVELGKMDVWADWYRDVLGFSRYMSFDDKDISTEYTALMSVVMASEGHVVKMPINEPAAGRAKSQIEEYIDFYGGPGVQHIALLTGNITETVRQLRENGVDFLRVPDTYYETLAERVGPIDEDIEELKNLGVLVDRDDEGYLLQLFSQPVQDRPTVFFEIIQRKGCRGFGKGNFKALFESIEREQELRGNL